MEMPDTNSIITLVAGVLTLIAAIIPVCYGIKQIKQSTAKKDNPDEAAVIGRGKKRSIAFYLSLIMLSPFVTLGVIVVSFFLFLTSFILFFFYFT